MRLCESRISGSVAAAGMRRLGTRARTVRAAFRKMTCPHHQTRGITWHPDPVEAEWESRAAAGSSPLASGSLALEICVTGGSSARTLRAVCTHYECLDDEIRSRLPRKRVWVLADTVAGPLVMRTVVVELAHNASHSLPPGEPQCSRI